VINKIDRPSSRPDWVLDQTFDLFDRLGATDEQMDFDVSDHLDSLSNVIVFHGDADAVVPYDNALEIVQRVREPKKLVPLPDADHPPSDPGHQEIFINHAVKWYEERLI